MQGRVPCSELDLVYIAIVYYFLHNLEHYILFISVDALTIIPIIL